MALRRYGNPLAVARGAATANRNEHIVTQRVMDHADANAAGVTISDGGAVERQAMRVVRGTVERIDIPSRHRLAFAVLAFLADDQIIGTRPADSAHDRFLRSQIGRSHDAGARGVFLSNLEIEIVAVAEHRAGGLRRLNRYLDTSHVRSRPRSNCWNLIVRLRHRRAPLSRGGRGFWLDTQPVFRGVSERIP